MLDDHPWVGLLIGALAMTPFVVQVALVTRTQLRERAWTRTTGVVLHTHASTASDGVTRSYRASYSYTAGGRVRSGSGPITFHATNGTEIPVVVDPHDPARSQPRRRLGVAHWLAGTVGLLAFTVGVAIVVLTVQTLAGTA